MIFNKKQIEMVANRLIMDEIRAGTPECETKLVQAWCQIYPEFTAPSLTVFMNAALASTRYVLEQPNIHLVPLNKQQAFVCERFYHFHLLRLRPAVKMEELRSAVKADMCRIGMRNYNDSHIMAFYASRRDPEYALPEKSDYTPREEALVTEMYQWLIRQYTQRKPLTPQSSAGTRAVQSADGQQRPRAEHFQSENAVKEEGRTRRQGRDRTTEELEARTIARVKGQLAIDLLLMNGEISPVDDSDDDIETTERMQFVNACLGCAELPEEYKDEQNLTKMWDVVTSQDKMLFSAGSMSELLDSRFTVIACRCLLYAMARMEPAQVADIPALLAKAFELWGAFQLDSRADVIRKLLERTLHRCYLVKDKVPDSVLNVLRVKADDIVDAYDMFLEQIREEQKQHELELSRKLSDQRKFDQLQQKVMLRNSTIALIKKFTTLENGAALGWLCMAVNGADYSSEKLRYYIENLMQRLESVGLSPVGVDKVACVFDGNSAGTEVFIDMNGRPLEGGVQYQMAQLGWMHDGEIVVYPMAERV